MVHRRTLLASLLAPFLRAEEPEVSNFDLSLIEDLNVPNELFYVREHFPQPRLSAAGWKVAVSGSVVNPGDTSIGEIFALPRKVLPVTLECAENPVGGGLVSHAEWTGTSLAALLSKAQPTAAAQFVRLSGADGFTRTIPLSKAMHPDTLLAHSMNGEKLLAKHGSPLRALVPGWYGTDSIKWLREITVLPEDSPAAIGTTASTRLTRSLLSGTRPAGTVTAMNVKSSFSRPVDGAILKGRNFIVRGVAWSGENKIASVEVSTDGGLNWRRTTIAGEPRIYSWVPWSFEWSIPKAADYVLAVRAIDAEGRSQPEEREPDRVDGYELNAQQRIRISVT